MSLDRVIARVLNNSLADFEGKIQSAKRRITNFEILDNAQSMEVVIERKPVLPHGRVQSFLSRVPKRRMPEIMHQGQRLNQIGIQPELRSDRSRDLRDLNRMRQPVAEVIRVAAREDLRLRFQTAKRARVDDTIAVTLKVIAIGMRRLGKAAPARVFNAYRVIGQHEKSLAASSAAGFGKFFTAETQR